MLKTSFVIGLFNFWIAPVGSVGGTSWQPITNNNAVTKKDVIETCAVRESNPLNAVILAFNVKVNKDVELFAKKNKIPIFNDNVIYLLVEKLTKWKEQMLSEEKKNVFEKFILSSALRE